MFEIKSKIDRNSAIEEAMRTIKSAISEKRELRDDERARVDELKSAVDSYDAKAAEGTALLKELGGAGGDSGNGDRQYLDLGSKALVKEYVRKMQAASGSKALAATGDVTVGLPLVNTTPVALNRPANSILQLLPVVQRAPYYTFLKQSTSADNAAVVAPGALKPTSTMGLVKVQNRLRVVATLSEPIDRFVLEDNSNLEAFVASQLTGAVMSELEDQILNGDGTGENFTGLLNTSGIQTHTATSADRLVTLFEALAKLESAGVAPSAIVLPSTDWTAIATTRNTGGGFDMGGAIDTATRRVWGTPAVLSNRLTAGTALVLGEGAVELGRDAGGIRTDWGTPGDAFTKNQLVARTEGRFSVDVLNPLGVVEVDLTAA